MKNERFSGNTLKESLFIASQFKHVRFEDNDLEKANFWETSLAGIDFSTNQFERLDVSPELAKNIKVNLSQVPFFAALHGIDIV